MWLYYIWRDKYKANIHELDVCWNKGNETKKKKKQETHTKHWIRFHRGCSTSFHMQHNLSEIWRENIRVHTSILLITGFFNINPVMQNMFIVFVPLCLFSSSHFLLLLSHPKYSLYYESAAGVLCVAPRCPITGVSIELFSKCKYFNIIFGKQTTDLLHFLSLTSLHFLSLTSKSIYCKLMTMMMEAVRRSERSELWIRKKGNVCRYVMFRRVRLTTINIAF